MKIRYQTNALAKRDTLEDIAPPPVTVWVRDFEESAVKPFMEDFNKALDGSQSVIPILINSYGGEVDALLAMVDICRSSSKPIATIVMGKAMSAGAVLLSCGWNGYRYAAPNSRIMIHEVSSINFGKSTEICSHTDESKRLNSRLFKILDENCQKPKGYFWNEVHERSHADWFLSPEDALSHSLVNKIGVPEIKVEISVNYSFEG